MKRRVVVPFREGVFREVVVSGAQSFERPVPKPPASGLLGARIIEPKRQGGMYTRYRGVLGMATAVAYRCDQTVHTNRDDAVQILAMTK